MKLLSEDYKGIEEPRIVPVRFVKNWCDRQLTPVAWARILIRVLPIIKEYGHTFMEIQNPTILTKCTKGLYRVILATIEDIHGKDTYLQYKLHVRILREKQDREKQFIKKPII